jgi:AraC-like DNA-binding protein
MQYVPRIPGCEPLVGAVEVMFFLDGYSPDHVRERIVPNGRMTLVLELDGRPRYVFDNDTGEAVQTCQHTWLSGVHERHITIGETRPVNRLMAVQFAPGASVPFTGRPASEFRNAIVSGDSVFGPSIFELRDRIVSSDDPEARLDLLESWLVDRFDVKLAAPEHLTRAIERLVESPSDARITTLAAEQAGISSKHFIELFRRHVGTTPKVFQRVLRFSQVFEALQRSEPVSWAELSAELGYVDQSHLHHEFRLFSGYRPGEFRNRNDDRVNFFAEEGD